MNRLKRILIVIIVLLVVWAIVNPFLFQFRTSDEDAIAAFEPKGMNFLVDNFKYKENNLHYTRIGDTSKTVLLFVHGSPGCWDFAWDYYMDTSWQSDYELVSIDRPGFGYSNYGQARNLFEQSEIISAMVRAKFGNRKIQLIGHSYGGPLVLQLCADNDSLFDICIIMAGSVSPQAEKEEWQLNVFSKSLFKWLAPGSFEQGIEELLWLKDDLKSEKYLKSVEKIKTPILGIYGTDDNMVPYHPNVDFLMERFDSTLLQIHTIEGGSHFIPWENYEEMKSIIRNIE